ncbi:MAG: ParB/RepB/Spo0J family partition protein [Hyphomonadaceae bacterium]|nr:ParB/RepB/Spo0J family partition protein [Clostridia bacterium]
MAIKKGLGKGLDALFDRSDSQVVDTSGIVEMRISDIEPNLEQPRKAFDHEKLAVLADSIKMHGMIQPIIIQKLDNGFYQIIAGERRWRAAKLAGLKAVPVLVKELGRREIMEVALIENIQREDLNPVEEAVAYRHLMEEFELTQEQISERVGKSRSAVANALRLLNLPIEIKDMVVLGLITGGHARALLSLTNKAQQAQAAQVVSERAMSVRETEQYVKQLLTQKPASVQKSTATINLAMQDIQNRLSESLGTKVTLRPTGKSKKIEIEYYSDEDLERILGQIEKNQ